MNAFDVFSILVLLAAVFGVLNHHTLKLPSTIGIMVIALISSIGVLLLDRVIPAWHMRDLLAGFVLDIDFNETLMHGMLCFLLFAGALHVELDELLKNKWTIGLLASVGVVISTGLVGIATFYLFNWMGFEIPFLYCLCFGALISPTDPIAVLGILKELSVSKSIESKIAGESLFNDGVAVVIFLALVSLAGLEEGGDPEAMASVLGIIIFLCQEILGGALVGLGLGYIAFRTLKSIDNFSLELIVTLALVMFGYSLAQWIHVSGPIAVVMSGLLIGNHGRRLAMSQTTIGHLDVFWNLLDESLNAVLFLLLGLEVLAVELSGNLWKTALLVIPVVVLARGVSVWIPVTIMRLRRTFSPGIVPLLTWGGLRGGISVALLLSLPPFPMKKLLLTCTYGVVLFSILVQGLTLKSLVRRYTKPI